MGASNQGQNRTFYKLKVEKESNIPIFIKQKKENGVWVTDQTFNTISGYLKRIELSNYVYEGDTIDTMKFMFDDDEDKDAQFQVETGFNYLSRNILNTLAGADNIGHVKITVYKSKGKDGKDGFPAAYLEINKIKAGWKYKPEELPRAKEVKVGGKTLKDTTELDAFFKELIPELNNKIISEFDVSHEMTNKDKPTSGKHSFSNDEPPVDDLPFKSLINRRIPTMIRRKKI